MTETEYLDGITQPVWLLDEAAGRAIFANAAARLLSGDALPDRDTIARLIAEQPDWTAHEMDLPWQGRNAPAILALSGWDSRYRLAARAAGHVVFDWDIQSGTLQWKAETAETFGYDPAVFPERLERWLDRIHPDDRARMSEATENDPPDGSNIWQAEYRFLRADGSIAHVIDRGFLLRDSTGAPRRMIGSMIDVSAIHEAEDRFRLATSASTDVIFILDFDTGTHWWSEALQTQYGHDPHGGAATVDRWFQLIHPTDRDRIRRSHAAALASGAETWTEEYRFARADGCYAHVIDRARFFRNADGRLARSVGSIVDVTALRDGQERFRLAAEASQDVIYTWSPADGTAWRSDSYARLFGYDPKLGIEGPGSWRAAIHRDDLPRMLAAEATALAYGVDRWETSYRVHRSDGRIAHVIDRAAAARGPDGAVQRIVGSIVDVSSLHEEKERLRAVLHVAADMIYEMDLRADTVTFSDGALENFGLDWAGTHKRPTPWLRAVHPDESALLERQFRAFVAGRRDEWRAEYRLRRGNGTYAHVRERAVALRDEDGEALRVIGSVQDVSDQVETAEKLHQTQKLEAIGKLTGGVAHDFNNLLTVMLGNAELLADRSHDPDSRAMAEAVMHAAERGAELIGSLLAFARKQPLRPLALDPRDVLAELNRMLLRTLPAYISLRMLADADLWLIEADPTQLQTALLNLAVNAADAMPEGGQLMIEVSNVRLDADYAATNPGAREGEFLRLALSDTGSGMPADVIARAFDPFFTTKPVGKGSGLGLSMVHGFVSQSGGHVNIYSEPGLGTTVSLYLPRSAAQQRADVLMPASGIVPMGAGEHIVAAEDDPALRHHVKRLVESLGYRVTMAADGSEALAAIRAAGDVTLLFTDVVMPGELPGRLLAEKACAEYPSLRVLFTSGYTENSIVHHGRLDHGVQLLSKPYRRDELARKLRAVLDAPLPTLTGEPVPD